MKDAPTFLDLFCGAGGMSLGFCQAGFSPLVGVDLAKDALDTYERNLGPLGAQWLRADLADPMVAEHIRWFLDAKWLPTPDVVVAGLPQAAVSVARSQRVSSRPNDALLFHGLLHALPLLLPKFVLVEVLPSFASAHGGAYLRELTQALTELDYQVGQWNIRAADFGVPQQRERLYLVASRVITWSLTPPSPTHTQDQYVTTEEALSDLPPAITGRSGLDRYPLAYTALPSNPYQSLMRQEPSAFSLTWAGMVDNHIAVPHGEAIVERFRHIGPGGNLGSLMQDTTVPEELKPRSAFNSRNQRPHADRLCYSVTAHCMEDILHFSEHRGITPREAARLQSFPDWFVFSGPRSGHHGDQESMDQYEQVGNATPPLVAKALAEALRFFL